jgi:hypothetical protein
MKLHELESKLKSSNIRPDMYSLTGGLPNEAYCIGQQNGIWEVYYSERGSKTNLKTFQSEEEACLYFHNWLLRK